MKSINISSSNTELVTLKFAEISDVPLILQFIKKLAAYEKLENEVVAIMA